MESLIEKKQLTQMLYGGPSGYQQHHRTQQISSSLYEHDLSVYTDDVDELHDRNLAEWRKLVKLLREGKITQDMLLANTWNTFYPSYILHQHYTVFLRILRSLSKPNTQKLHKLIQQANKLNIVGSYFETQMNCKTHHSHTKPPKVSSDRNGTIQMNTDDYFYGKNTSLLINYCAFIADTQNGKAICILRIRNNEGSFLDKVQLRDFGATISADHQVAAYNFNGMTPELIIPIDSPFSRLMTLFKSNTELDEFRLSLSDLKKSLYLTIKYTSMRRQFPTIQGTKEERQIITYQAVSGRIIDGYSALCAYSFLNLRLTMIPQLAIFFTPILQYAHHTILERLIHLRQCCGGFGYLQYSGHPGCIERTAYRAANKQQAEIPDNKQFLKRAHYYSGDDALQSFFGDKIEIQNIFNISELFRVFILICVQMRKRKTEIPKIEYTRQFVKQASIQAIWNFDSFGRPSTSDNIALMTQYLIVSYILDNGKYINWSYVKMEPSKFFEGLHDAKRNLTMDLSKRLQDLCQILEVAFVRNAILGRQKAENFYDEVLNAARTNKRNSKDFLAYVKQPIIEMITENRKADGGHL